MRRFQGERVKSFMSWAKLPEDEPIEHSMISRSIAQAQVRVEGFNFDIRKRVLEYDDVVNKQREVIYAQRQEVLSTDNLREKFLELIEELIVEALQEYDESDDQDIEALHHKLYTIFPVPTHMTADVMAEKSLEELENLLIEAAHEAYARKSEELGELMPRAEKLTMLRAIDMHWQRHLTDLDMLREGIGLMSIAQRDPLVEYKREAFNMWQDLQDRIKAEAARSIYSVQMGVMQRQPVRRQMQAVRPAVGNGASESRPEPVRATAKDKLGRNDPCWCGSGKKYKNCHYHSDKLERSNARQ
jgi:preprotein translocase subunit SecA